MKKITMDKVIKGIDKRAKIALKGLEDAKKGKYAEIASHPRDRDGIVVVGFNHFKCTATGWV